MRTRTRRGLALGCAALAVSAACSAERAPDRDSARGDSLRAPSPPVGETTGVASGTADLDAYAARLDSLARRDSLRLLFARVDPESDDSWGVEGWYSGDSLVVARADLPADSVGAISYYLRAGAPVVATVARIGSATWVPGHTQPPVPVARYYLRGDSIVERRGETLPIDARRLVASLATLRSLLLATARGRDFAPTDSVTPRPVAPYVVHGACPFECCRYGKWKVLGGAVLRAAQSAQAPVVGHVASGTEVRADSGNVVVDTIGVVAVSGAMSDIESGRTFAKGDTVLLLDYQGEGYRGAWLRGHMISVAEFWSATGANGAKLVRAPHTAWWTHFSIPQKGDTLRGWVNMTTDSVRVSGSDACGG